MNGPCQNEICISAASVLRRYVEKRTLDIQTASASRRLTEIWWSSSSYA